VGVGVLGVECGVPGRAGLLEFDEFVVDVPVLDPGENAEPPRRSDPRGIACRTGVHRARRKGLEGIVVLLQAQRDVLQVVMALAATRGFARYGHRRQE
jgi:hypothetical protein